MKVGIVVYSHTGNTYTVAEKLKEMLDGAGHEVGIERITITGDATPGSKDFQLDNIPEVAQYDGIIFGSPVQAFSLNPAMNPYMEQLPSLEGKKVACFVTKQLPLLWMGGHKAIAIMKGFCESKGATVLGTDIVVWSKARREESIDKCVKNLGNCFHSL